MKKQKLFVIVAMLLALLLVLAACSPEAQQQVEEIAPTVQAAAEAVAPTVEAAMEEVAPTVEAAVEEIAPTVEAAVEEVVEEPTAEPVEEAMAFEGLSVAAENCDYGGKISSITALDEYTVEFALCDTDPAFMAKIAFIPFGVQSQEWLESTGGTGELLEKPVGTGPYMVEEWTRGDQIVYKRFEDYWGDPAPAETAVLRWNQEGAARLVELQSGTVDFITLVSPDDYDAVLDDTDLVLVPQDSPNILYLAFTNTFEPFDNPDVRKAIAMGIDRQRIVDNFFPPGSEVASHFTPCAIPNGCEGEEWYEFDPEGAKALLAEAGYPDGFETSIFYRDVFRPYLPEPSIVAVDFQDQLRENLGIEADVVVMESGEFIAESQAGNLDGLYLLGWSADYPHVTNFLDYHFTSENPQFGDPHPEIYETLKEASVIADPDVAAPLYEQANNAIKELIPMVPIAHGAVNHAALATLEGVYYPPFGANEFYRMDPGKDTLVYMQNNEPISLYCSDESDGESLRPCQQSVEKLFEYEVDSGAVVPELATSCESNEDGTVWTCSLREGVMFHDGTMLDANDVVTTWRLGIDASDPLHIGNTGTFTYYSYLWDGLMNAPADE